MKGLRPSALYAIAEREYIVQEAPAELYEEPKKEEPPVLPAGMKRVNRKQKRAILKAGGKVETIRDDSSQEVND